MTDRLGDDRLPSRLATWFEREVRQADADLRRSPLRPARARPSRRWDLVAPSLGALLLLVLVVAGASRLPSLLGPAVEPSPTTATPSPPAGPPLSPAAGAIGSRFDDGIPNRIDGEPVIRPSTIGRLGPSDDRSFLLGGWLFDYDGLVLACTLQIDPLPFGPRCMSPYLSETPMTDLQSRVVVEGWVQRTGGGPVVLRVHRHDPIAATCLPERREACEGTAVIERVVWSGDEVTAASPITAIEALRRILSADPTMIEGDLEALSPLPAGPNPSTGAAERPPLILQCPPQYPRLSWSVSGGGIATILVFPTTTAREAVDQDFHAGGWRGANGCEAMIDSLYAIDWVAVDNVMVAVLIDPTGATPHQAALVEAVRTALGDTPG
jgi:hypothetical protein